MFSSQRRLAAGGLLAAAAVGAGLAMSSPALAAPANDNFQFAQFLPGPNNSIGGRNDNSATAEVGEPKHAGQTPHASVWYKWTAPASGKAIFRTKGSNFDTVLAVYTGNAVNALTKVVENDDAVMSDGSNRQSQVVFKATQGTQYAIAVDGFGTATGDIKLTWTTNDDFAAAQTLPGPVGAFQTFAVHTDGTTFEPGEPAHAGAAAASSVWYRWVAPSSGLATFEAVQGNFNSRMAAYKGNSLTALTKVAENDDQSATNNRPRIIFPATAGTEYRIAVDGSGGQQGFDVYRYSLVKPEVRIGDVTVVEGNAGTKAATLQVSLNTPAPFPVSVKFATKDGSAKAGSDYVAASGTVDFPAFFTFKTVTVQVVGDPAKELNEQFTVNLSDPTGGFGLGKSAGTITITNND